MMLPPDLQLGEDDFLELLQNYLPQGAAWPRDPDAVLTLMLRGLAASLARVHARELQLLLDLFPATTAELLPEWEASLGLPDPCLGVSPLANERRAQVVTRFSNTGGQSIAFFTNYAASLGYAITVDEFAPSRFGRPFGSPFGGVAWAFTWRVNGAPYDVSHFRFGADTFGTPFQDWHSTVPQCELQRLKPGHTTLLFTT